MIRTASRDDLAALRPLLARANDAPYDLSAVAEEKCFGHGVSGEPVVRVYGGLAGVSVTCGKWLRILAVDRQARRRGIGTALLRDAEARGARVVAAEPGNYFTPGVVESDLSTHAFFRHHGYAEVARTTNLHVDVGPASARGDERGGLRPALRRAAFSESERVLSFVERHFGRMWRFEAARAFERDEPTIFIAEEDREIVGFAAHEANNRGLGSFGPTGVAPAMRGRGIGCELLRASLGALHRLGHARAVIPWTDAIGFYRNCCGAEPAHRFVTFALDSAR